MKLLLRRNQKAGMMGMGKVAFTLDIRAELSDEEKANIKKYKLGSEILYAKENIQEGGEGIMKVANRLAALALNLKITVDDLVKGKCVECKDILEMLAAEELIKEACENFKRMLDAAAQFGGEQVLEFA